MVIVKLHAPEISVVIFMLTMALSIGSVGLTVQDEAIDVAQSAPHGALFTCSFNYE